MWYLSIACASIRKTEIMRRMIMRRWWWWWCLVLVLVLITWRDGARTRWIQRRGRTGRRGSTPAPPRCRRRASAARRTRPPRTCGWLFARRSRRSGSTQRERPATIEMSALSLCVPITNRLAFHWKTKTEVVGNRGSRRRMSHSSLRLHSEGRSSNNPL